ncbi:reverse transcriptase domain-containing protein [Amycolatopsis sp. WAC 01376]|uniref:reverse transcriptase domain-containing protein n=1 Tax=Amycolatopsis sp. WAC 01376 TaxID=2203195 RepID=UPI0013153226|nr:reverse transcriptase domain-containing protein [Amycolatopsis sp. WAC 01376]
MLMLGSRLLQDLNIKEAVLDEATWKSDLVPTPLVNDFAGDQPDFVSDFVSEIGQAGIDLSQMSEISASKWRYGRRPVALLPLVERVLYRAMVSYLDADLVPVNRTADHYDQFLRAPLLDSKSRFVVSTDLANFHSSIPTDRIAQELVQVTGRWEAVEWLRRFYLGISGGRNGIPHGSPPSTRIAEVYASELHRRLLLRGLSVWRYADDFRIGAASAIDCVVALDIFDEEARSLGLFVNERKTFYVGRDRYESIVEAPAERLQEISGEVEEDLTLLGYEDGTLIADTSGVSSEVAIKILEYWKLERKEVDRIDVGKEIEIIRLVKLAFDVLQSENDSFGLTFCHDVLRWEPQVTPAVASYMISQARLYPGKVQDVIRRATTSLPLTKWQNLWLLHVVAKGENIPRGYPDSFHEWLISETRNSLEINRSEAVWALARNSNLDIDLWSSASLRATRLGYPYLAAAFNGILPAAPRSLRPASALDRKIAEWVEGNFLICPF